MDVFLTTTGRVGLNVEVVVMVVPVVAVPAVVVGAIPPNVRVAWLVDCGGRGEEVDDEGDEFSDADRGSKLLVPVGIEVTGFQCRPRRETRPRLDCTKDVAATTVSSSVDLFGACLCAAASVRAARSGSSA